MPSNVYLNVKRPMCVCRKSGYACVCEVKHQMLRALSPSIARYCRGAVALPHTSLAFAFKSSSNSLVGNPFRASSSSKDRSGEKPRSPE